MPVVPAILLTNFLFGVAHAATKANNAIKAFGLGILFSLAYWLTDSLWLSMLLHIFIDIYASTISFKIARAKD